MRTSPAVGTVLILALVAPRPGAPAARAEPVSGFPAVSLKPGAAVDVVYDWAREHCQTWDVPDAPLRAVRTDRGAVFAMASDSRDRPFVGPDLDHIRHRCERVYVGRDSPDPAAYSGLAYITALWTADGKNIVGLVHDEYHAEMYGTCAYTESMKCWYNAVIATISHDGGAHFALLDPPVLVAAPPFRQNVEQGRHRGFFNPSNIIQKDAFSYTFISTTGGLGQPNGTCLFRTDNPADPASWRAYDGTAYTSRALDPYEDAAALAAYRPCAPVAGLPGSVSTVVRFAGHDDFFAISDLAAGPGHPAGVMGAWSHDLLHWSRTFLLKPGASLSGHDCANSAHYAYSSILDPASPARSFDIVGSAPYLYQTRLNLDHCQEGPDRDLIRLPLVIE